MDSLITIAPHTSTQFSSIFNEKVVGHPAYPIIFFFYQTKRIKFNPYKIHNF
jgi:hypothetical protein